VTLFVSEGVALKQIPTDIVNETYDVAKTELTALGFAVAKQPKADDTVPVNLVISSTPGAGTSAPVGSTVTLIVSTGPQQFAIPDVAGDTPEQARNQLTLTGFTGPFNMASEPSATVTAGLVTRTNPPKGTNLAKNKPITIYTSSGTGTTAVPPVIGQTQAAAEAALRAAGFQPAPVFQINDANVGLVVDQHPAAGSQKPPGTQVVITVGKASASNSSTTTTTGP
jgi:serine/threonine-protein kinase